MWNSIRVFKPVFWLVFAWMIYESASEFDSKGPPLCTDPVCYYEWDIRWDRSMTYREGTECYNVMLDLLDNSLRIAHSMYRLGDPMVRTIVNKHKTLTADAYPRDMIVINGMFPGPTISVMEGSTVEVRVTNHLRTDDTAIHFFGMKQFGTTQGDGVPYVSQCPIRPQQRYTYRFIATPAGTHWYHSAYQSQRVDGIAGMIVVHKQEPILPEQLMVVSDWNHVPANPHQRGNPYMWDWPGTGEYQKLDHHSHGVVVYSPKTIFNRTDGTPRNDDAAPPKIRPLYAGIDGSNRQAEGERPPIDDKQLNIPEGSSENSYVLRKNTYNPYTPYGSGYKNSYVLNGRGRGDANYYPLHRFFVEPGTTYRFRAVHVGSTPGLKIAIDQHQLRVVAVDGVNTDPHKVDMLFLGPGQRADFEVDMLQPPGRYWVRLWVQEHYMQSPDTLGQLGVLSYVPDDGDKDDPTTVPRPCTEQDICSAFNCIPYTLHDFNTTCLDLQQVRVVAGHQDTAYTPSPEDDYDEYFLNFAMPTGPTINGVRFKDPTATPELGRKSYTSCPVEQCSEGLCHCTNTLRFEGNRTIQLVLSNYDNKQGSTVFGHHSVHLHGHSFYLLKQGYPIYDKVLMTVKLANTDIVCDDVLCKNAKWRHEPTYNYERPLRTDVVVIPTMGYVVIRFKADNPGLWMLNVQDMTNLRSGMQLITMISSPTETWSLDELPKCGEDAFTLQSPGTGNAMGNWIYRATWKRVAMQQVLMIRVRLR